MTTIRLHGQILTVGGIDGTAVSVAPPFFFSFFFTFFQMNTQRFRGISDDTRHTPVLRESAYPSHPTYQACPYTGHARRTWVFRNGHNRHRRYLRGAYPLYPDGTQPALTTFAKHLSGETRTMCGTRNCSAATQTNRYPEVSRYERLTDKRGR